VDKHALDAAPLCDLPRERLIAYRDGTLRAAQLEIAQAHISTCPACRDALRMMDEMDRLLRDTPLESDDRATRELLKARIAALPAPKPPRGRDSLQMRVILMVAMLLLVTAGMLWLDDTAEGGSTFARWIRGEPWALTISPDEGTSDPPVALTPTLAITPQPLPGGLVRTGVGRVLDGISEHYYRRADGLNLLVVVDQTGSSYIIPPQDARNASTVVVAGREVHVQTNAIDRAVSSFFWTSGETFVSVVVLEHPPDRLEVPQVADIARVLLADPVLQE
jgi:hypothetical protein